MNEADFIDANTGNDDDDGGELETVNNELVQTDGNQDLGGDEPEVVQLSEMEQKAYDQGWRPEEDFAGKGDWKTAKEFVKDGEWLGKIKELNQRFDSQQKDFNERLENTNKLNEVRRESEIKELRMQQRNAVDMGDTDSYDDSQRKIDDLEKQVVEPATAAPEKDPAITAWEAENPWINEHGNEKAGVAQGIWTSFANQNPAATTQQALAHVTERISHLYPSNLGNPRRAAPNTTENTGKKPQRKNKDLSMGDLTPSEQGEWNQYGKMMFKTEKAFLKAVSDSRKK